MTTTDMSPDDKEFLEECEEEFKDRYTENDKEFMKVFKSEPLVPPVIENWWAAPNHGGRWNDRRHNRRNHPYQRNNRDQHRDKGGNNDYNNDNNMGQGYGNQRPRYY